MWRQKAQPPTLLEWLNMWKLFESSGKFPKLSIHPSRPPHIRYGPSREFSIRGVASSNIGTGASLKPKLSWKEVARKANRAIYPPPPPPGPPPGPPPNGSNNNTTKYGISPPVANRDQGFEMDTKSGYAHDASNSDSPCPRQDFQNVPPGYSPSPHHSSHDANSWDQPAYKLSQQASYPVSTAAETYDTDNSGLVYDGEAWIMDLDPQRIVPLLGQTLPTYTTPRPAPNHTRDIPRSLVNQNSSKADRFHADVLRQEQYLRGSKARKFAEAKKYAASNEESSRMEVNTSRNIEEPQRQDSGGVPLAGRSDTSRIEDEPRSATPQKQEVSTIPSWVIEDRNSPNTAPSYVVAQPQRTNADTLRKITTSQTQEWDMSTAWMHRGKNSSRTSAPAALVSSSRMEMHPPLQSKNETPETQQAGEAIVLSSDTPSSRRSEHNGRGAPASGSRGYITSTRNANNGQHSRDPFNRGPRAETTPSSCLTSAVAQELSQVRANSVRSIDVVQDQDHAVEVPRVKRRRRDS
ncbi:hypothetical protein BDZ45DRAFT_759744 [Acephala macrosclerotiorum]|nr:hypothetical protein BDZ45DRAFT_759744 [Acephala macrosclerotiorum]